MILGLIHLGTQQNMTQPPTFVGARSCYEYFQRDPIGQFANSVTVKRAHDYIPTNMSFSYKMQKTSYKMQKPVHPRLQQRMPVFSAKSPPCICDHAADSASVRISARTRHASESNRLFRPLLNFSIFKCVLRSKSFHILYSTELLFGGPLS